MSQLSNHDKAILNCIFNPNLPLEEATIQVSEEVKDEEEITPEVEQAIKLEIQAVQLAENGSLGDALTVINEAIKIAPKKPSLYNNRAYIYQFLRKSEEAFDDATTAISLSDNKCKKTLCQAHCQRGLIHRRADRLGWAREDFEIAANMGSKFAKGQLVELNPYAALCNQMLRQVMDIMK